MSKDIFDLLRVPAATRRGRIAHPFGRGLAYLLANARRAHPDRDRRTGRLRAGLMIVEPA